MSMRSAPARAVIVAVIALAAMTNGGSAQQPATGLLCGSSRDCCTDCDPLSSPRRAERAQRYSQPAKGSAETSGEQPLAGFDGYFSDKTMRVDYFHSGGVGQEIVALDRVVSDGPWPGSRTRLVTAQDMLLTPAYALHGYRFGRSGRWFNMQLTDSWLARVADGAAPLPDTAQRTSRACSDRRSVRRRAITPALSARAELRRAPEPA